MNHVVNVFLYSTHQYYIFLKYNFTSVWSHFVNYYALDQCFPTFFDLRHPYLVMNIFCGTPRWFDRYKYQGILTFGGTPGTS